MSTTVTHGYGLVLEMTDQAINDRLPAAPFGTVSGASGPLSIAGHRVSFDYSMFFPVDPANQLLYFDTSIPDGVVIRTEFSLGLSGIEIDDETIPDDAAINGTISIHHPISAWTDTAGLRCIGFDFTTLPMSHAQVDVTSAPGIPLPENMLEAPLANLLRNHLQNNVRTLAPISVPLVEDSNPMTPGHLDVRVVNDHCLTLLASSSRATSGNPDAFTDCVIPEGANVALIVSNATLLREVACPQLIGVLGLEGGVDELFRFDDATAELSAEADVTARLPHVLIDRVVIPNLRLHIGDNRLEATATVVVEGSFYRATAEFVARASIAMNDDGELVITYGADVANVRILIEPWAWILAMVLGPLIPIIGGIIAALVPALAALINPIFDAILSRLVSDLGGSTHFDLAGLPLRIDSVTLDDLICSGQVVPPEGLRLPQPTLWIEGQVEASEGEGTGFEEVSIVSNVSFVTGTFAFAHQARFVAKTYYMVFPITFDWFLDSQPLRGTGSVDIQGVQVEYVVDGDRCDLSIGSGESISAYLTVNATPYEGSPLTEPIYLQIEGSITSSSVHGVELLGGPGWLGFGYGSYVTNGLGNASQPWGFGSLAQFGYPVSDVPGEAGNPPPWG